MIRVELFRAEDGAIVGFRADGHSGYAPRGSDIVCAAVSALTTVTVLGLQQRIQIAVELDVDEDRGYLQCRLKSSAPSDLRMRAQDLLETMALGLYEIARQHSKWISVKEVSL